METAGVEPASEIISSSSHPQAWKIFLNQQNFSDLTVVGDRFLFDFYNLSVVLTRLDRRLWSASLIKPLGEQNQSVRYYWQLIGFDFLSHHDCLHYSFLLPRRILNVPVILRHAKCRDNYIKSICDLKEHGAPCSRNKTKHDS